MGYRLINIGQMSLKIHAKSHEVRVRESELEIVTH